MYLHSNNERLFEYECVACAGGYLRGVVKLFLRPTCAIRNDIGRNSRYLNKAAFAIPGPVGVRTLPCLKHERLRPRLQRARSC
ncbi:hypothetical protein EVAR_6523_1 [Eumeta japonica]|uniref:Uncharacterized protein n=1 Tax=Eumeta variegata TaxID=151549 RepID=A0A4C1SQS6_EUMVA|nr:hypothetical protein EVAR_6523_1 [Eumeta japonica]